MKSIFDSAEFNANLFFPRRDDSPAPGDKEEIYIAVEPGIRVHLRRYPLANARFTLLYFHGNGEIVSDYDTVAPLFADLGAEFIVCDYRGYGKSDGIPRLRATLDDSHKIFAWLNSHDKMLQYVVVMGRSIGSAPAIELCANYYDTNTIHGCVIESGYADPVALAKRRGLHLPSLSHEDNETFNNSHKITKVQCPLLIMHGAEDSLIFPEEAQLNYGQAESSHKKLEILAGVGHNNIMFAPDNGYFRCLWKFFSEIFPG